MGILQRETSGQNQATLRTAGGFSARPIDAASVIDMPSTRVIAVQSKPDYWLAITYADGCEIIVDLGDVIRRGGVFKPLQDERLFSQVRTSPLGDGIEWPKPKNGEREPLISIDAESIYRAFEHTGMRTA